MQAVRFAREQGIPFLGLCLGLQCAVIEFARSLLHLPDANSSEFDPTTAHPVIDLMESQQSVDEMGGTMRLGLYPAALEEGSLARRLYGKELIYERHRHRFEVNNRYRADLEQAGMRLSGLAPDDSLVEIIELPGHPLLHRQPVPPRVQVTTGPGSSAVRGFIAAALERRRATGGDRPIEAPLVELG